MRAGHGLHRHGTAAAAGRRRLAWRTAAAGHHPVRVPGLGHFKHLPAQHADYAAVAGADRLADVHGRAGAGADRLRQW